MSTPFGEQITPGRFAGQTVVVTGAGAGIGRAVATRVGAEGSRGIATDVVADRLAELADGLPEADLITVVGDISAEAAVAEVVAAAGGRVDALANNAGVMDEFHPVHEVTDEIWDRVLRINVTGQMRMMRAVVPLMLAAGQGTIVNVSSEAGLRGSCAGAAYTVSKHGVIGLTKSSAVMYAASGIRVNAVCPGAVMTSIEAKFSSEMGTERLTPAMGIIPSYATAEELAASITWLLSADSSNVNGAVLASDGGWSAY